METTLMIKCDIKHAPEILLAAQKIIEREVEAKEHKIKRAAQAMFSSLSILEWLILHSDRKEEYICRDSDGNEFDIGIFDRVKNDMRCELCNDDQQYQITHVVGTKDSREPKYCFSHYQSINVYSRFIKEGV